ncbi:MAG TPA: isopentenyl-diphosphate delta-isomerase [Chitinophagaceae bacterium]|nr:isopentenyl-diphosphate delta-isomerase [Chitinophagaceae bacterium]HAN38591.1 isopentenyl-diphosphate delta-isomerase [Chitinophagaceae bacterium]
MEFVILVNEYDEPIGQMEKMEAHRKGLLHRAFSVFAFNEKGEMLLQQRAKEKYHSPALWTNACCSHPRENETVTEAAERRLFEELGFSTKVSKVFSFTYKASFDNGLVEHEFDHVLIANITNDTVIQPNPHEVMDYCFMSVDSIQEALQSHPEKFTAWFHIAFPKLVAHLQPA